MTARAPELVRLVCPRPDCTNTVTALPGSTAVCGRHPRPQPMAQETPQ